MANTTPFMQRRGDTFSFRIAVPQDLRSIIGMREITRTLSTTDRRTAAPLALEYAARAKRMFSRIRAGMNKSEETPDMAEWLKQFEQGGDAAQDVNPNRTSYTVRFKQTQHGFELDVEDVTPEEHANAMEMAKTLTAVAAIATPTRLPASSPVTTEQTQTTGEPIPTLKMVVNKFLADFAKKNKKPMLDKHTLVLSMLLEVTGDKPITNIRQTDVNDFFDLVQRLPPRWKNACRKHNISIQALGEIEHEKTIGPNSFNDTYLASVRPFLKEAKLRWGDRGFPFNLAVEGIEYTGEHEEGEHKQRSFKTDELIRLFTGKEMQTYAQDPSSAHCYWLPHLALFTGARVRELCQLNPQTDILQDEDSVWYLWITENTPGDPRIVKSIKTGDSRKVPIHKTLIGLGFLEYVERVKSSGALLLFPAWEPDASKRASVNAEKWFCELLRDTQLRDETPGAKIVGMHAFRHTLLTHGAKRRPALNLTCITGHAQGDLPIPVTGEAVGYITKDIASPLIEKADILNMLDYGLAFIKPTH